MGTYNRRTFIKHSAMATAIAAASRVLDIPATASPLAANVPGVDHPFFAQARNHPEVIAHRGGDGQWPGETMHAFREAMKLGVDVLEMDVYSSHDGELILMHDPNVKTTTEVEGRINELDSTYLLTLNAGHHWSPDGGKSHPYRDKANVPESLLKELRVVSLEEVFKAFPGVRMNIEMKKAKISPAPALSKMIQDYGMTDKVLVASFVGKFMNEFRRLSPKVATSLSLSKGDLGKLISGKKFSDDDPNDPRAIQMPYKWITDDVVRKARERNLKLHAWTVNDLKKMSLMKTLKVDGIITDYPGPLLSVLDRLRSVS
jgi:glycerophosphoryl diester phosphodiesterase